MKDLLAECAESYQRLIDEKIVLQLELFDGKKTCSFSIKFTSAEFKHLTSIEKLADLEIANQSSKDVLAFSFDNNTPLTDVLSSTFIIDDTNATTQQLDALKKQAADEHKVLKTDLIDRISCLKELSELVANAKGGISAIKAYEWDKTADNSARPNGSQIQADLLLEIYDGAKSKPYTCLFVVHGEYDAGMSVFPSIESHSKDSKKVTAERIQTGKPARSVKEYEILSIVKTDSLHSKISLVQCSPARLAKCQKLEQQAQGRKDYNKYKEDIKDGRKGLVKAYKSGNERKIEQAEYKHEAPFRAYSENPQKFPNEYLEFLICSLQDQSKDQHNQSEAQFIESEIKMAEYVKASRELILPRELFVTENNGSYIDIQDSFIKSVEDEDRDFVKTILEKQKQFYINPRNSQYSDKTSRFSEDEIKAILQEIDKCIAEIDKQGGKGTGMGTPAAQAEGKTAPVGNPITDTVKKFSVAVRDRVKALTTEALSYVTNKFSDMAASIKPHIPQAAPVAFALEGGTSGIVLNISAEYKDEDEFLLIDKEFGIRFFKSSEYALDQPSKERPEKHVSKSHKQKQFEYGD